MTQLTLIEQNELQQHEAVIERGLKTFVEVGMALAAIRDGGLYKQSHATFEDYCQRRWRMARQTAYQYIDAAQVTENVRNCGHLPAPANEAQARPLARLEPEQQREAWALTVETAPHGIVTAAHVKKTVRMLERGKKGSDQPLAFPQGTFSVIYADPPWSYDNSGFTQSAASHYETMATDEICELSVGSLCTPDSVLFLWATSPLLDEAFKVISAWGFTYKASMVWNKGKAPGMGWFVQTEHELLLIATREANTHPKSKPKSVVGQPPGQHSAKPDVFYGLIESMYEGPYCELFARRPRNGWSNWGNEV